MHQARHRGTSLFFSSLFILAASASAQIGPDVIVGDLLTPASYGSVGGIYAYALGTTSCNIGDQGLTWVSSTNQHPVIGQNIYRVSAAGRFEQVGLGHLKHGFTALAQSLCATCQNPGTGSILGVNCSDPYTASLNGSQSNLGPRFEVNAATGFYPYPFTSFAFSGAIARRCQGLGTDLDPALNAGATYFGEGHYIHPVDAAFGNKNNNASYRRVVFAAGTLAISYPAGATTQRMKPAIQGWQDIDPTVTLTNIDVPNDGRMILGRKTVTLGGGLTRFEYALHNLNSDRCASGVHFFMPAGANVSNLYFHDVPYHSGEPMNSIDWTPLTNASEVAFTCTETFAQNQWANAIRWGSCYNFSFVADAAPGAITIDLFKPGTPTSISIGPVFAMDLSTIGGGAGNLHFGLDNIPPTTAQGLNIFSFAATQPLGGGNLFGIYADQLSFLCLVQPLDPGSMFHFTWPVAGIFPAVDIDFPVGAMPFPAGFKADGVSIVLNAGLSIVGTTAPVRITF